jgi:hypothetical protein
MIEKEKINIYCEDKADSVLYISLFVRLDIQTSAIKIVHTMYIYT